MDRICSLSEEPSREKTIRLCRWMVLVFTRYRGLSSIQSGKVRTINDYLESYCWLFVKATLNDTNSIQQNPDSQMHQRRAFPPTPRNACSSLHGAYPTTFLLASRQSFEPFPDNWEWRMSTSHSAYVSRWEPIGAPLPSGFWSACYEYATAERESDCTQQSNHERLHNGEQFSCVP